jgi:hypothetical protein
LDLNGLDVDPDEWSRLDLDHDEWSRGLRGCLTSLHGLRELSLSGCQAACRKFSGRIVYAELPPSIAVLTDLRVLKLQEFILEVMPPWFENLTTIQDLTLKAVNVKIASESGDFYVDRQNIKLPNYLWRFPLQKLALENMAVEGLAEYLRGFTRVCELAPIEVEDSEVEIAVREGEWGERFLMR